MKIHLNGSYSVISLLLLCIISCGGNETSSNNSISASIEPQTPLSIFPLLHQLSEGLYDGNGTWGQTLYSERMALRDSYWRADVYGELSNKNTALSKTYLKRSSEVALFLMKAQAEGGTGVYGFPAEIDHSEFGVTIREVIEKCPTCINNGWVITLPGTAVGELYYDHGYALSSLVLEYKRNKSDKLLASIIKGANWAVNQPLVSNVNYLSALSKGLTYAYSVTNDKQYLERALFLHQEGILPKLSKADGAALDSHNQQLEYHGFITSGLVALIQYLPKSSPEFEKVNTAMIKAIEYMVDKNVNEIPVFGDTWLGTNLLAWYELSKLRPLSIDENNAKNICLEHINSFTHLVEDETGFRLRKALYIYFMVGLFET